MNDPFLSFPVPYPWSRFRRTPSTAVLTTTRLNLTCITELRRWVDTPMIVTHSWKGPSGNISHSSSHPRVSNVTQVGRFHWSSIFFSSGMRASDSGIYICIVSISSVSPYIAASDYVAGFAIYLPVGKEVACTTCKWLNARHVCAFTLHVCQCNCTLSLQPSRLWLTSATLHLRRATSLHTTEQHRLSPWPAELWVQLVE